MRTVGLAGPGVWHAPDALVAALFAWLPIGTRAYRAELASAAACGVAGAVLYLAARELLGRVAQAPILGTAVAAIASTLVTLSAAWQVEAVSPGGAVLGALLVWVPLVLLVSGGAIASRRIPLVALALGAAWAIEPFVGAQSTLACAAFVGAHGSFARGQLRGLGARALAGSAASAFAMGIAPMALALVMGRRSLAAPPVLGATGHVSLRAFLHLELGWTTAALAAAGLVSALASRPARPVAVATFVIGVTGLAASSLGSPRGPDRYGAAPIAALAAMGILAGACMQTVVRAVVSSKVPLAAASAAMIVLLELTFPVLAFDDALQRLGRGSKSTAVTWDQSAWAELPPGPVLFVHEPRLLQRVSASRAAGELRGDLTIVPLLDVTGAVVARELAREPRLGPLVRDLLVSGLPEEWSLSSLASVRPVAFPFDPGWPRPLAQHLLPAGLVAAFEAEPKGPSDRLHALDATNAERIRLAQAVSPGSDAELSRLTASLFYERALTLAALGERDLATRVLGDVLAFSPLDPRVPELSRRLGTSARGPVDVSDLVPRRAETL